MWRILSFGAAFVLFVLTPYALITQTVQSLVFAVSCILFMAGVLALATALKECKHG